MFKILETDDFIFERNEILKELYKKTFSKKIVMNLSKEIKKKITFPKKTSGNV